MSMSYLRTPAWGHFLCLAVFIALVVTVYRIKRNSRMIQAALEVLSPDIGIAEDDFLEYMSDRGFTLDSAQLGRLVRRMKKEPIFIVSDPASLPVAGTGTVPARRTYQLNPHHIDAYRRWRENPPMNARP